MTSPTDDTEQEKSYGIQVKLTEKDYKQFCGIALVSTAEKTIIFFIASIILSATAFRAIFEIIQELEIFKFNSPIIIFGVLFIVMVVGTLVLLRFFNAFIKERSFYEDGSLLSPKTIKIDYSGVTEQSNVTKSHTKWAGIHKISDNDKGIYFFIDKMQAYIIPKDTFETKEAANEFVEQARHYWQLKSGKGNKNPWNNNNNDKDKRNETDPE